MIIIKITVLSGTITFIITVPIQGLEPYTLGLHAVLVPVLFQDPSI